MIVLCSCIKFVENLIQTNNFSISTVVAAIFFLTDLCNSYPSFLSLFLFLSLFVSFVPSHSLSLSISLLRLHYHYRILSMDPFTSLQVPLIFHHVALHISFTYKLSPISPYFLFVISLSPSLSFPCPGVIVLHALWVALYVNPWRTVSEVNWNDIS